MTLIFHVHSSQELYQATDSTSAALDELEALFPTSTFLQTQRALLYYHNKGRASTRLDDLQPMLSDSRIRRCVEDIYQHPHHLSSPFRRS